MPAVRQIDQVYVRGQNNPLTIKCAVINAAQAGDNVVVAAVTGKKIRVLGVKLSAAADVTSRWMSDIGDDRAGAFDSAGANASTETWKAGGGMSDYWGPHGWFCQTATGKALNLYLGGAVQVSGFVNYVEVV